MREAVIVSAARTPIVWLSFPPMAMATYNLGAIDRPVMPI